MSNLVNFIVKTKDTKESEIKKALKEAGINVISVATIYKEEIKESASRKEEWNAIYRRCNSKRSFRFKG